MPVLENWNFYRGFLVVKTNVFNPSVIVSLLPKFVYERVIIFCTNYWEIPVSKEVKASFSLCLHYTLKPEYGKDTFGVTLPARLFQPFIYISHKIVPKTFVKYQCSDCSDLQHIIWFDLVSLHTEDKELKKKNYKKVFSKTNNHKLFRVATVLQLSSIFITASLMPLWDQQSVAYYPRN